MVDLPSIPRRLVTSEAPKSLVTAADVAQPFTDLGRSLDKLGDALTDVSVVAAENQAAKAVTRDAEGNVSVSLMPDFTGKAGRAYNRLAKQSYLAQLGPQIDNEVVKKRLEFEADPGKFNEWGANYVETLANKQPDPETANAVRTAALSKVEQVHRGLLVQRHHVDVRRANEALDAKLISQADDIERLTRQGAPQEAVQSAIGEFDNLLNEKVNNPLIAFPREKANLFRDAMLTRAHEGAILEGTERVYQKSPEEGGGYQGAVQHLKSSVKEVNRTIKDSAKIERAGMAMLNSYEKALRGERDQVSREWTEASKQLATLPSETLDSLEERATQAGAWRVASDIRQRRAALGIQTEILNLPREQQLQILRSGSVPPELVDRIIGVESGGNPNARAATSSAAGLGQFTRGTWLSTIKRYRPDVAAGKSDDQIAALRTDGPLSREMTTRYTEENKDVLHNAGVVVTPGALYGAHFLGPGDAVKVLKADPNTPIEQLVSPASVAANREIFGKYRTAGELTAWMDAKMSGKSAPAGSGSGGGGYDLTQNRTGLIALNAVKESLKRDLDSRIKDFASADRKLELPSFDEISALGAEVAALGTPEQRQRVAELAVQAKAGDAFRGMAAPQRAAEVSAMDAALKEGGSRFERELRGKIDHADQTIRREFKEDPYGAHVRFSAGAQALPPINFENAQQMQSVLAAKVRQQAEIRAREDSGAFSVLRPAERESFRNFMSTGSAEQIASAMSALSTLDSDVLRATLSDPQIKDAVRGAMRSTDPGKYTAVMSSLDQIHARDRSLATTVLDTEGMHALATWQSNTRYLDPKVLAAERARADDPQAVEQRKRVMQDGAELARKKTAADVVKAFDTSWYLTPGFVARDLTGSQPVVPADARTLDVFMGDYETLFSRRFAETRDADTAHKQTIEFMKDKWRRSDINGGRLMLRAPEQVYPAVNGAHDYLKPQIEKELAARLGPRLALIPGASGIRDLEGNAWDYALVSDRRTETEAQTYDRGKPVSDTNRPPGYVVVVRDNRKAAPQWDVLLDNGREARFRFDPSPAKAAAELRFGEQRDALQALEQTGLTGAP